MFELEWTVGEGCGKRREIVCLLPHPTPTLSFLFSRRSPLGKNFSLFPDSHCYKNKRWQLKFSPRKDWELSCQNWLLVIIVGMINLSLFSPFLNLLITSTPQNCKTEVVVTVVIYLVLCFLLTNCTATLAHRSASVTAAFSCWNRSQSGNWLCSAVFTSSLSSDTSVNKHWEQELSQPLEIWLEGKSHCLDESLFHQY